MAQMTSRHSTVPRLRPLLLLLGPWCVIRTAPGTSFATLAQKKVELAQLQDADLEELKLLKSDLEETLRSIRLSAPTSVMAFGKKHPVPSTVEDPEEPSPEMLRYLSGHFAGSGTISSQVAWLQVAESGPDASNLFLFQKHFGGRVYVMRPGSGFWRPTIRWSVRGPNALRAAQMMSKSKLQKQQQLVDMVAGRFGQGGGAAQDRVVVQHWAEVAGLFDACLSVRTEASSASPRVEVPHADKHLLEALAAFLHGQLAVETIVRTKSSQYRLLAGSAAALPILRAALENGLVVKREAAELVLGWSKETHQEVRQKLQELKSNSHRFSRLTEAGAKRAREIDSLKGQLRRKAAKGAGENEIQPLTQQIAKLVCNHQRLQLAEEIQRLRDHLETVEKQVATKTAA